MRYHIKHQQYFIRLRFKYAVKHFEEWMRSIDIFPYVKDGEDD